MRMATLTLSVCLAAAPGIAGAQAQDQLTALEQAIRVCSDPMSPTDDWTSVLIGWKRIEPTETLISRYSANTIANGFAYNDDPIEHYTAEQLLPMYQKMDQRVADALPYDKERVAADELEFYEHDSGWQLAFMWPYAGTPFQSSCMVTHDRPNHEVLTYLGRPYFGLAPYKTLGGRNLYVEAPMPTSITGGEREITYNVFLRDLEGPAVNELLKTHPIFNTSTTSLEIVLTQGD